MPTTVAARTTKKTTEPLLVVSTGCPSGIGPEVSLRAAQAARARVVLVGDDRTLRAAAELVGVARARLVPFGAARRATDIELFTVGPGLSLADRRPGRPSKRSGAAQLEYVRRARALVLATPGAALVTGPVSKEAIARSGVRGSAGFRGHTEWLGAQDRTPTVMCFHCDRLATSLVTTHLPLGRVPSAIDAQGVRRATVALVELLRATGREHPRVAVCSLNPHAGEGELLGREESQAILPGIALARRRVRGAAVLSGPLGAETAYRRAASGALDGVVAMYHDQATIPMKLLAFGDAVNVTVGLPYVRTSVDHGTGYDIAWRGTASDGGMLAALALARRLLSSRSLAHGG